MNREIKFRVFDTRNKKMITNDVCYQLALGLNGSIKAGILEDILMQFSGLKDKNNNEIYEGDVIYIAGEGKVLVKFPFFDLYERVYCGDSNDIENILGNIYENPELTQATS